MSQQDKGVIGSAQGKSLLRVLGSRVRYRLIMVFDLVRM